MVTAQVQRNINFSRLFAVAARGFLPPGAKVCGAAPLQPATSILSALNKLKNKHKLMLTHCNANAEIPKNFAPQMPPLQSATRGGRPPSPPFSPPSLASLLAALPRLPSRRPPSPPFSPPLVLYLSETFRLHFFLAKCVSKRIRVRNTNYKTCGHLW